MILLSVIFVVVDVIVFFYIYSCTDDDVCFKINASISSAIPVG